MLRYSKLLFGILAVLGAALLVIFFVVFYWNLTSSAELLAVQILLGDGYLDWSRLNAFLFFTIVAGTAFLVFGMIGTIVRSRKKHRAVFAVLCVTLVPVLVFGAFFSSSLVFSSLQTQKVAISNFRVDNTNPLTCAVDAKSFSYYEIDFDSAFIKAANRTIVAQISSNMIEAPVLDDMGHQYMTMNFLYTLPPGDEQTLNFNFNTTLPSGNYAFWLSTYERGGFISFNFTIP